MFYRSPRQELQEIEADPSGGYGPASTPTLFLDYPSAVYEQAQNLVLNSGGNNLTKEEIEFYIAQCGTPSASPLYTEANLSRQQEADAPPLHYPSEKQIPDPLELIFFQSYSEESEPTSSGQSSPSISGSYCSSVADSPLQPPHEASYGSPNFELRQSTPRIFPDRNLDTQHPSR